MALVRTMTATCDSPECGEVRVVDPNTSQPYRDLSELGWTLVTTAEGIETFCPQHKNGET